MTLFEPDALGRLVRRWPGALALLAGLSLALPAAAVQHKPANLARLIGESELVVSGKVQAVTEGVDAKGLPYTEVTILVGSSAKKRLDARTEFKFRQYGLQQARRMPDGRFLVARAPEGFPTWRPDEQVVAFMFKPASKTGLRTTVGLSQGKFTSSAGKLVNAHGNHGLFAGVTIKPAVLTAADKALLASPAGAVDAAALMSLVNRAAAGKWIEKGVMR
jgi:hypothetical protein